MSRSCVKGNRADRGALIPALAGEMKIATHCAIDRIFAQGILTRRPHCVTVLVV